MQQQAQNNQTQNSQLRYAGSRSRMTDDRRSPLAAPEEIPRPSEIGVPVPQPTKTDAIPGGWEEDVLGLLTHFDAQESAMLALKSLLQDLGAAGAENEDTRRLRIRMDAATDLCLRLDSDCRLIVDQLAERMQMPQEDFAVRHLIAAVHEHNAEMGQSLRLARQRLLKLSAQVRRISATTAWILSGYREIRQAVFQQASGVADSDRYDASGRKSVAPDSPRYGTRS
jgi:hypothetical protein